MATPFTVAKAAQAHLEQALDAASVPLRAFPRLPPLNLVADDVRQSQAYREARTAYDHAFNALRTFNASFTRLYKTELRAERRARSDTMHKQRLTQS